VFGIAGSLIVHEAFALSGTQCREKVRESAHGAPGTDRKIGVVRIAGNLLVLQTVAVHEGGGR
jgi:hypothetical protein